MAGAIVAAYGAVAEAAPFDLDISNSALSTDYSLGTNMGEAVYEVEVANSTGADETVSPTVTPSVPDGATVTGISATAVDSDGAEVVPVSGKPDGQTQIIDEARIVPAGETITYTVTVGFTYTGTPTELSCAADGGIATSAALAPDAEATTADACIDAPAPPEASSSSAPADPAPEAAESSAAESESETQAQSEAPEAQSAQVEPQAQSAPESSQAAASAAAPNENPSGSFGAWVNDGLIYFSGWAYDPSDMGKAPTTMWTLDGKVVAYSIAQLASPDLYPYGVFNRGVFGAIYAPSAGKHQMCMFVFNIGAGSDQLTKCIDVHVASGDPTGDLGAMMLSNGDLVVGGYAYDPSNVYAHTPIWITDNGKVVGSFYANHAGPDLSSYGVPGNHGFNYRWGPTSYGNHNICLYVHNIGWGNGTWPKCVDVAINPDAGRDNPRGDFAIYHNQGSIGVTGWAYDPNQYGTNVTTMWTVDGSPVGYASANLPHSGVNVHFGVGGNHGVTTSLPASVGWHTVCMYVVNVGLGSTQVTRCINIQVTAPPNPCPAYAKACVDLTNNLTWLQSNGQITYGPVKQIAGKAGYRTPTGTYKVFWKNIDHKSSIYNNAPMPYSIFFNGGIAFHVGALNVPSHGCIHLSWEAARVYWDNLQVGDIVYVFGAARY